MVTTCEETVTGSCRHGEKYTEVCLSCKRKSRNQCPPLHSYISPGKIRSGKRNQHFETQGRQSGPALENWQVSWQSGRRGKRNRGEDSSRNSPEHPRELQGPLGRVGGWLIRCCSGTCLVWESTATSKTSPEMGRAHELWLVRHRGRRKIKLFLSKVWPR